MTKDQETAAMEALEQACPGLYYILILGDPVTSKSTQVSNVPPEIQKAVMEASLKYMDSENYEVEQTLAPGIKHND